MAFYANEEEIWKCPKHPSKRRRNGICPTCLRDRLLTLCPYCANVRPCVCSTSATTSSSSSSYSSSSFSRFSFGTGAPTKSAAEVGSIDRVSKLINSKPSFRRSRSVAIPFVRSELPIATDSGNRKPPLPVNRTKSSFWSIFKTDKSSKSEDEREVEVDYARTMMTRSRSVSVSVASNSGDGDVRLSALSKWRGISGWYFLSPIKAFRQSKTSKVVHERSQLYRG